MTNVSFVYDGNGHLMSTDSQIRNVSLNFITMVETYSDELPRIFIDFNFKNSAVQWLLISEIKIIHG